MAVVLMGNRKINADLYSVKLEERNHFEELVVEGRMILKWILEK